MLTQKKLYSFQVFEKKIQKFNKQYLEEKKLMNLFRKPNNIWTYL